jgi:16S rRNA (cytosine1402-N4)-methyltransferase
MPADDSNSPSFDSQNPRGGTPQPTAPSAYATGYHAPVLWLAVTEGLVTDPEGVYVDATLGGGGHSAALLDALAPAGRVIGVDQDDDALTAASERLRAVAEAGRFTAVKGNFADLPRLLASLGIEQIDGLLADFGVSSFQLDQPARGFSYASDGPLDMRMDSTHPRSAADLVQTLSTGELRRLLFQYGEEPRASRIASAITKARAQRPIETTAQLAEVVRGAVPEKDERKSLARVFQALRIEVNDELGVIEALLGAAEDLVRVGGRIALLSYHSLEDRRAKRMLKHGNLKGEPQRDFYGNRIAPWREITRKPIEAGAEEIAANPRARSARLRLAERVELPETPSL